MAAGLGFKTFTTGEVLTSGDTNGYLMQGVLVFASAAARDAAITSPQEGQFAYLKDTNTTTYYTGSAWTDLVSAGSGGLTLLSTTTLTGASITVSSISSSYKNLLVVIKNLYLSVNDDGVFVRFNGDTGAKYQYANYRVITSTVSGGSNVAATSIVNFFATNPSTATASKMGTAVMNLYRYTDTDVVQGDWYSIAASDTSVLAAQQGQFSYDCTAAITSITIAPVTANFSGGTMYIYGVN